MASRTRTLSGAERERRRRADRDRLERAARALLSSDGWQRWVRVRSSNGLARYSFGNQLLIAMQTNGHATYVAGFRAWLTLNRPSARARRRSASSPRCRQGPRRQPNADGQAKDDACGRSFSTVAVFDVAQTEPLPGGDPVPLSPASQPIKETATLS